MDYSDTPTIDEVLADKASSFWIKNALQSAIMRDPVDAAEDAAFLSALLDKRVKDVLARGGELQRPPYGR